MTELQRILMGRDGLSASESAEQIRYARQRVDEGDNPEEVLREEFGLEPDYFLDLYAY